MGRPTPEQLSKSGSEDGHQTGLFAHIATEMAAGRAPPELKWLFAIPNGGSRGDTDKSRMIQGGKLKAAGVKRGVPDTCLPVPRRGYLACYIELKRPASEGKRAGTVHTLQTEWHVFLRSQGYFVATAFGWEGGWKVLQWYMQFGEQGNV